MKKWIVLCILFALPAYANDLIDNIESYHQNSKWQKSTAIALFDNFLQKEKLTGSESLLDICSGDGKITAQIAQKLPRGRIIGIDSSEKMVQFARQHYQTPSLQFQVMDALKLNYPQQFDIITSFTCMHLIADQHTVLQRIHQSLKPNGQLLMIFPVVHGFGSALETVTNSPQWYAYFKNFKPQWHFFAKQKYEDLLDKTGFKIERLVIEQQDESYNRAVFTDAISHWLPHLKMIPQAQRADFLNDLVDAYLQQVPVDNQGQVHFYVDNMIVQAKRING